jgi:hypothetical protein
MIGRSIFDSQCSAELALPGSFYIGLLSEKCNGLSGPLNPRSCGMALLPEASGVSAKSCFPPSDHWELGPTNPFTEGWF